MRSQCVKSCKWHLRRLTFLRCVFFTSMRMCLDGCLVSVVSMDFTTSLLQVPLLLAGPGRHGSALVHPAQSERSLYQLSDFSSVLPAAETKLFVGVPFPATATCRTCMREESFRRDLQSQGKGKWVGPWSLRKRGVGGRLAGWRWVV